MSGDGGGGDGSGGDVSSPSDIGSVQGTVGAIGVDIGDVSQGQADAASGVASVDTGTGAVSSGPAFGESAMAALQNPQNQVISQILGTVNPVLGLAATVAPAVVAEAQAAGVSVGTSNPAGAQGGQSNIAGAVSELDGPPAVPPVTPVAPLPLPPVAVPASPPATAPAPETVDLGLIPLPRIGGEIDRPEDIYETPEKASGRSVIDELDDLSRQRFLNRGGALGLRGTRGLTLARPQAFGVLRLGQ